MKKTVIIILLLLSAVLVSCKNGKTEQKKPADPVTAALTKYVTEKEAEVTYGEDWRCAALDRQILAEDENWSVTGSGFSYKNGSMGCAGKGYFDLAGLYNFGDEENLIFEFEYSAEEDKALYLGLNLLGIDSMPNDAGSGIWLVFGKNSVALYGADGSVPIASSGFTKISARVDQTGKTVRISADGKLSARVTWDNPGSKSVLTLYGEDDTEISKTSTGFLYSGGCAKLRSVEGCHVYIKNAAYKAD